MLGNDLTPECLFLVPPSYLRSFLFKLLNGSLVDAPAFVDEVARGGGLAGVHVTDDDNVDVEFLLCHGDWSRLSGLCAKKQ